MMMMMTKSHFLKRSSFAGERLKMYTVVKNPIIHALIFKIELASKADFKDTFMTLGMSHISLCMYETRRSKHQHLSGQMVTSLPPHCVCMSHKRKIFWAEQLGFPNLPKFSQKLKFFGTLRKCIFLTILSTKPDVYNPMPSWFKDLNLDLVTSHITKFNVNFKD